MSIADIRHSSRRTSRSRSTSWCSTPPAACLLLWDTTSWSSLFSHALASGARSAATSFVGVYSSRKASSQLTLRSFPVDEYQHSPSSSNALTKVRWHPWGEGGNSLWVLGANGKLLWVLKLRTTR